MTLSVLLMRELFKAQIAVGVLACFSIGLGTIQRVFEAIDPIQAFGFFAAELFAVFILSFVLLAILKWTDIFDLKTDAILTFLVLVIPLILL